MERASGAPLCGSKVLNYVGWTGHGNMGDQALYKAIQNVFGAYKLAPTTNSLVLRPPQLYSGITLFGGGTLLPIWATSAMANRFNYAYGVAVVDPSFFEFQYGVRTRAFYELAIQRTKDFSFRLIGVRGLMSKRLLESWRIKSQVIGDPCLLFKPDLSLKKDSDLVAVSVGSSEPYEPVWGKTEDVAKEVTKFCSILTGEGYDVVLVPFSDVDIPHIRRVSKETGLPIFGQYRNAQATIDFVSTCHVLVGQRLHSAVFSAAALTPFLSIEYHPKCGEFSESVGFQEYVLRAYGASAENLSRKFRRLINNWDNLRDTLKENVEFYRERLLTFASRITKDIESLPDTKWRPPEIWKRTEFQVMNNLELRSPSIWRLWNRMTKRSRRNTTTIETP